MPTIATIRPLAALPNGELHLTGTNLGPGLRASIAGVEMDVILARPTRATLKVPEGTLPGDLIVTQASSQSAPRPVQIAVPMAENLHPVANPASDAEGNVYTTLSGPRGQQTPVSIFRIAPAAAGVIHELRPLTRDILNSSGLAFSPAGELFVSSRAEGTVYRIAADGSAALFAEGLGIATGIAFDPAGDLYVGDRSGTIFKIRIDAEGKPRETFVFATLEPSIAAYHLAFDSLGTLYVTGPTTSSSQSVSAIDPAGHTTTFYSGLGRAQGLAFDAEDNLYVAASLHGERGIVRITPARDARVVVSGPNLIGLCFLPGNRLALTTRDAVYEVSLDL
jgi:sugar lactone lactonase YvrE